jgi:hypothetical protein
MVGRINRGVGTPANPTEPITGVGAISEISLHLDLSHRPIA